MKTQETQAIVSHSLQAEQQVVEQLRTELPSPTLGDFPETGGEALPGAEYEVDYVEPPAQFDTTTGGTVQDTVEGPPFFDFHRPASGVDRPLGTAYEAAGTAGLVNNPRSCINHEHCGRAHSHSVTMNLDAYCCDECAHTNGRIHADDCSAVQVIGWHVPGSAAMESTLNDDTLTAMRFDAGQDTLDLVGTPERRMERSGARVGAVSGGGVGVLPSAVFHPCKNDTLVARHLP